MTDIRDLNKVHQYGKNDANRDSTPLYSVIGLDTRKPTSCDNCIYYRPNAKLTCLMPGGCGKQFQKRVDKSGVM